jgi:hypothetical protein
MKILLKENQLESLVLNFVLDKLKNMEFKMKKNKEFSFFPIGGSNKAALGIEADWVKGSGWDVLVGENLWNSVGDMFGLSDEEVKSLFVEALKEFGIRKVSELSYIDFSSVSKILFGDR